jgi:hypothetical protein
MSTAEMETIEREVEETRARLSGTIDRIQDKLTVSGIVDEVMGASGVPRLANGHDFVLGLLRRHPLPVMVAAAGVGWLVYRMNRRAAGPALDANVIDVPVLNTGHARVYDPDLPARHATAEIVDHRRPLDAQA